MISQIAKKKTDEVFQRYVKTQDDDRLLEGKNSASPSSNKPEQEPEADVANDVDDATGEGEDDDEEEDDEEDEDGEEEESDEKEQDRLTRILDDCDDEDDDGADQLICWNKRWFRNFRVDLAKKNLGILTQTRRYEFQFDHFYGCLGRWWRIILIITDITYLTPEVIILLLGQCVSGLVC